TNPQHLRFAIDKLGAHRIMFGTDWSATWRWISVPTSLHKLRLKVLDDANLTEEERRLILWDNAVKIFKLDQEAARARSVFSKAAVVGNGIRNCVLGWTTHICARRRLFHLDGFVRDARLSAGRRLSKSADSGDFSCGRQVGIKIFAVHYRGAPPAVTDMLGDHDDFKFSDAPFFLEHIKAGN